MTSLYPPYASEVREAVALIDGAGGESEGEWQGAVSVLGSTTRFRRDGRGVSTRSRSSSRRYSPSNPTHTISLTRTRTHARTSSPRS